MSDLPSSGFTHTDTAAHGWCLDRAGEIRQKFKNEIDAGTLVANIFPYRHYDQEYVALDFWDDSGKNPDAYPITFNVGFSEPRFESASDPFVQDMVEALHLAGIILASLNIKPSVGRQENELNHGVLAEPLKPGQTNGRISLRGE